MTQLQIFKNELFEVGAKVEEEQDEALRFIQLWRPSTSLQMEIDGCNSQMTFK